MMQIVKPGINVDFVNRRKVAFTLSAIVIIASIVSLIVHGGPRQGIDFSGGAELIATFNPPAPIETVKSALTASGLSGAVQKFGDQSGDSYRIVIAAKHSGKANLTQVVQQQLSASTGSEVTIDSFEMVGPQVGQDMQEKALLAIFFAILFITVYISGRFELKWLVSAAMAAALFFCIYILRLVHLSIPALILALMIVTLILFYVLNLKYAMGAIVALVHDVLITVGLFSFFDKEFTLPIIAALLTIIGYSLNDTIIVFDRIRENISKYRKESLAGIINRSVNETLSRTILTSGTTLLVLIALFILGGGIIHDFAFALLVGVIVGTYSSIFVASPILLAWQKRK